jgi:beta-glucanase (GH16 family)
MARVSLMKQPATAIAAITVFFLLTFSGPVQAAAAQIWVLQPQLSDEFNYPAGTSIDTTKWYFQTDAHNNGEAQQYTNAQYNVPVGAHLTDYNFKTTDTSIQVVARAMKSGNYNYTSGRINSQCRMFYTYGKFEFRLKPPAATVSGLWPAVWMLGNVVGESPRCPSAGAVVGWPGCGEVDVWEYQSSKQGSYICNGYSSGSCQASSASSNQCPNQAGTWRIYSLEWNSTQMKWWYRNDGEPVDTVRSLTTKSISGCSSFTKNLFYLINLAVGGTLGTPISCSFPQTLEIDYLRTYKLSTDPGVKVERDPQIQVVRERTMRDFAYVAGSRAMRITVSRATHTRIAVYDLGGRLVSVAFEGRMAEGTHTIHFGGTGSFVAIVNTDEGAASHKIACY